MLDGGLHYDLFHISDSSSRHEIVKVSCGEAWAAGLTVPQGFWFDAGLRM